jgi:bacterioferritin-associated ferredoxin
MMTFTTSLRSAYSSYTSILAAALIGVACSGTPKVVSDDGDRTDSVGNDGGDPNLLPDGGPSNSGGGKGNQGPVFAPALLPPRDWLISLLASRQALSSGDRMALLSGRSPVPMPSVGRIVCSCFNVGANQISAAIASGCASVSQLGEELRAGTNCGACRSEIRKLLDENRLQAAE